MKIIDAHVHFSNVLALKQSALDSKVDYSALGLQEECKENNIITCVSMGLSETSPGSTPDKKAENPMLADLEVPLLPMTVCLGINPYRLDEPVTEQIKDRITRSNQTGFSINNTESKSEKIAEQHISGFKIYAGYYHVNINDDVYKPIYKMAADNDLAVVIHSGETYFQDGLIEYSHPLHVDRLAYEFRDMKIVICHMGFPWVNDACEMATKNKNVYIDISGLAVGGTDECDRLKNEPLIRDYFRQGLVFLNNYKKIIYGSDWPLVKMQPYIDACKALIPSKHWEDVFYSNAVNVYGL